MRVIKIKSKTLRAVEPRTDYMGCTFYLEGPHCLDYCFFDNCSFRGELHYTQEDFFVDPDTGYQAAYPSFYRCGFPGEVVVKIKASHGDSWFKNGIGQILNFATKIIVNPIHKGESHKTAFECDLPKIKTIDLSAYESYSEIPVEWFERFPTLEEVILPKDITVNNPPYICSP